MYSGFIQDRVALSEVSGRRRYFSFSLALFIVFYLRALNLFLTYRFFKYFFAVLLFSMFSYSSLILLILLSYFPLTLHTPLLLFSYSYITLLLLFPYSFLILLLLFSYSSRIDFNFPKKEIFNASRFPISTKIKRKFPETKFPAKKKTENCSKIFYFQKIFLCPIKINIQFCQK